MSLADRACRGAGWSRPPDNAIVRFERSSERQTRDRVDTGLDAAGVQLLYTIQRTLMEAGHTLKWNAGSETLRDSVALLGICELLALPAAT